MVRYEQHRNFLVKVIGYRYAVKRCFKLGFRKVTTVTKKSGQIRRRAGMYAGACARTKRIYRNIVTIVTL